MKKAKKRYTKLSDILGDEDEEDEALQELAEKIKHLKLQKRLLEEKKEQVQSIKGPEEIKEFYEVLGNFSQGWPKLTFEQKQKLIGLLVESVEINILSPRWLKVTVKWIGPVLARPDVALVWRKTGEKLGPFTEQEKEVMREYYPTCTRYSDLLSLLPQRSYDAIVQYANTMKIRAQKGLKRVVDFPINAAWADVAVFPDFEKGLEIVKEAIANTDKVKNPLYALWLYDGPIDPDNDPTGSTTSGPIGMLPNNAINGSGATPALSTNILYLGRGIRADGWRNNVSRLINPTKGPIP